MRMNPTEGGSRRRSITLHHAPSDFVTFHHSVRSERSACRTWHAAWQCDQVEGLALALGDEAVSDELHVASHGALEMETHGEGDGAPQLFVPSDTT